MKLTVTGFSILMAVTPVIAQVRVEASKTIDYTRYETFTLLKGESSRSDGAPLIDTDKLYELVLIAVQRELGKLGYRYVSDSSAQLYVGYLESQYQSGPARTSDPFGNLPVTNPAAVDQQNRWQQDQNLKVLIVELTTRKSSTPIWSATANLSMNKGQAEKEVDAIIIRMFKKFPDRNAKKRK